MIQKDIAGCGYLRIFLNYLQEMRYGTENIQGIAFNLPVATDVKVSSEAFTHMTKLRLLKLHNVNASQAPNFLPGELRWLDWHGYPSKSPMACLLEVHAEATAIREVPSSIECLTNLRLIDVSNCKHLESLPSSICRLKGVKSVFLSGCSKFEKLPDELGEMECLGKLYCDKTAIQELPSSVSLLKKLKILSFRGCKPTQKSCSFFLSRLLPAGAFQDIKASPKSRATVGEDDWRETKVAKTSTSAMLKSNAKPVSESDQQMLSFSLFWKGDDSLAAWLSASKLELMFKLG
nr:TMV resistance protein N-like [Ipomoea batatas]